MDILQVALKIWYAVYLWNANESEFSETTPSLTMCTPPICTFHLLVDFQILPVEIVPIEKLFSGVKNNPF